MKELWENNTSQRDMMTILTQEGFDIKERELMRVRTINRWLLRARNSNKQSATANDTKDGTHGQVEHVRRPPLRSCQ